MQSPQTLRAQIRHSQFSHTPLLNKVGQTIQQRPLLPRGIARRTPVQLHPLKLAREALLTGVKRPIESPPSEPPRERRQFGGNRQTGPLGWIHGAEDRSQQGLTTAVEATCAIGISRIHQ